MRVLRLAPLLAPCSDSPETPPPVTVRLERVAGGLRLFDRAGTAWISTRQ